MLVLSLLAGAAIGAVYTLQGVYAYELIDPGHLGTLLGIPQAVFATGGALGSLAAGALLGATDSYTPAVTIISAGFAAAASCSCSAGQRPGRNQRPGCDRRVIPHAKRPWYWPAGRTYSRRIRGEYVA